MLFSTKIEISVYLAENEVWEIERGKISNSYFGC